MRRSRRRHRPLAAGPRGAGRPPARVDGVSLHPGRGDRLGAQRVRQVELVALILEQLGEPLPAIGRLKCDLALAVEPSEQLQKRIAVISIRRERSCVPSSAATAMWERLRCRLTPTEFVCRASFDPGFCCTRGHSASGTGSLGGPFVHGISIQAAPTALASAGNGRSSAGADGAPIADKEHCRPVLVLIVSGDSLPGRQGTPAFL